MILLPRKPLQRLYPLVFKKSKAQCYATHYTNDVVLYKITRKMSNKNIVRKARYRTLYMVCYHICKCIENFHG